MIQKVVDLAQELRHRTTFVNLPAGKNFAGMHIVAPTPSQMGMERSLRRL